MGYWLAPPPNRTELRVSTLSSGGNTSFSCFLSSVKNVHVGFNEKLSIDVTMSAKGQYGPQPVQIVPNVTWDRLHLTYK